MVWMKRHRHVVRRGKPKMREFACIMKNTTSLTIITHSLLSTLTHSILSQFYTGYGVNCTFRRRERSGRVNLVIIHAVCGIGRREMKRIEKIHELRTLNMLMELLESIFLMRKGLGCGALSKIMVWMKRHKH